MGSDAPKFVPLNPSVRSHAILLEVIGALWLVGVILAVGGGWGMIAMVNANTVAPFRIVIIAGLAFVPGVLYIVAAAGLSRRRRWAWVMSFCVTVLLLIALLAAIPLFVSMGGGDFFMLVPGLLYVAMPGLILLYMLRALPVVREAELLVRTGFMVIPRAQSVLPAQRVVPMTEGTQDQGGPASLDQKTLVISRPPVSGESPSAPAR